MPISFSMRTPPHTLFTSVFRPSQSDNTISAASISWLQTDTKKVAILCACDQLKNSPNKYFEGKYLPVEGIRGAGNPNYLTFAKLDNGLLK